MRKLILFISLLGFFVSATAVAYGPNDSVLPLPFIIYTNGNDIQDHASPGFYPRRLPTVNYYSGSNGCYVFCYSHQAWGSVFRAGDDIYINGQIRVPGHYVGSVCRPATYGFSDISRSDEFTDLCSNNIRSCQGGNCWAGGDTGRWFGL